MKLLKLFFKAIFVIVLFLSISLLIYLENLHLLNNYLKEPLKDLNISLSLKGGVFSGIKVLEFNYNDDIKIKKLDLKLDYFKLIDKTLQINSIKADDLAIKEGFINWIFAPSENEINFKIPYFREIRVNELNLTSQKITYDKYKIENLNLNSKNNFFYVATNELISEFMLNLNSNILNIESLKGHFQIDKYHFSSNLKIPKNFVFAKEVEDKNITLQNIENIKLLVDGNFKKIDTKLDLSGKNLYKELKLSPKKFNLTSSFDINQSILNLNLNAILNSNISNIELKSDLSTNLNDINNTTIFNLNAKLDDFQTLKNSYLYKFSQDENLNLEKLKVDISSSGNLKEIKANVKIDAKDIYKNYKISLNNFNSDLKYDILNSKLNLTNTTSNIETNISNIQLLNANVNFDVNSLNYDYDLKFNMNEFKIVELSELNNLMINLNGNQKNFNANLNSHLFNSQIYTNDFNFLTFKLNSNNLYFAKIIKNLPKEFEDSFVKMDLNGNYNLNLNELNLEAKLLDSNIYQKKLKSNKFKIYFQDEDLKVENLKLISDKLKINLNATKLREKLNLKLSSNSLTIDVNGGLNPFDLRVSSNCDLSELQDELNSLYPFEKVPIDGKVHLNSKIDGNLTNPNINLQLNSKKVLFEDKEIKNINLTLNGTKENLILKNVNFKLDKFVEKDLNREFYLTKDVMIKIKDENITISEIILNKNIFINAQKIANEIDLKLKTNKLFIEKYGYGKAIADSNVNINYGEKVKIIGEIVLNKLKITYQIPKNISPPSDDDIIIVKKTEVKKEQNSLKNYYINLDILNKGEVLYKNENGEIAFNAYLKILKEFDAELGIYGNIEILKGEYNIEGKKILIEPSYIRFIGTKYSNPLLDLKLKYIENKVEIFISVTGNLKNPKLDFSSIPDMPKKDIISYLVFGQNSDDVLNNNAKTTNYSQKALIFLSNSISKDIAKGLGLELDKIDISQDDVSSAINVEVGKKLTDDITVGYKNSANKNSIVIEYNINKNLGVESTISNESNSIDLFYKKEY